ncbi:hypothetical protein BH11BAC4_BH11BAC4_06470 [soil metagenome]
MVRVFTNHWHNIGSGTPPDVQKEYLPVSKAYWLLTFFATYSLIEKILPRRHNLSNKSNINIRAFVAITFIKISESVAKFFILLH